MPRTDESSSKVPSKDAASWALGDFLATLNFFGEVPFIGSFRWLQQLMGQSPTVSGRAIAASKRKVAVLGEVSTEMAAALRQQLPTLDVAMYSKDAMRLLAQRAAIHSGDAKGEDASALEAALIGSDTVVVLPIEDTATTQTMITTLTDILSVDSLVSADSATSMKRVSQSVFDFTQTDCDIAPWGSLDDVVMGGVSKGQIALRALADPPEQAAMFSGVISTDNSGGFSSVRTRNFEPPFDFAGWQGLRLRVKGDGQRYKFIARNSDGWDSPAYIYSFDTVADSWVTVEIPFAEMVATFRAKSMPDAPAFDPAKIYSFQLMLSKFEYDRQLNPNFSAGAFSLAIATIDVFRQRKGVPLLIVSSGDEASQSQLQSVLAEVPIEYRLVTQGDSDLVSTVAESLASD